MVLVLVKICNQDNHNVNSVCTVIARNLAKKSIQNMARPAIVTDDMVFLAQQIIKEANTARELREGLSVLIPKTCDITYYETAKVLGVGVATVVRMQRKIRDQVAGKPITKALWEEEGDKTLLHKRKLSFFRLG